MVQSAFDHKDGKVWNSRNVPLLETNVWSAVITRLLLEFEKKNSLNKRWLEDRYEYGSNKWW